MLGISCRNLNGSNSRKRESITMREYYVGGLLLGRRLFQQFIVDAYTSIEEERLQWVRFNKKNLRSKLYYGLKDAVLRGDTDPITVGKLIVLPSSFTGSPSTWFKIIKMQWRYVDGQVTQIYFLHLLAIQNGQKSIIP